MSLQGTIGYGILAIVISMLALQIQLMVIAWRLSQINESVKRR